MHSKDIKNYFLNNLTNALINSSALGVEKMRNAREVVSSIAVKPLFGSEFVVTPIDFRAAEAING